MPRHRMDGEESVARKFARPRPAAQRATVAVSRLGCLVLLAVRRAREYPCRWSESHALAWVAEFGERFGAVERSLIRAEVAAMEPPREYSTDGLGRRRVVPGSAREQWAAALAAVGG